MKTAFLDRDGVIIRNDNNYYIWKTDDLILNEGLIQALNALKEKGFSFIVISNQSGIAKGIYTKEDVDYLHEFINNELAKEEIKIMNFLYCPHHPDYSSCICRKPDSAMIEKAIYLYDIDIKSSIFIGDSDKDIQAAVKAGINAYKVKSNSDLYQSLSQLNII